MVVQEIAGCIIKGPLAERPPHAAYLTDFLYLATDTGDLWLDNGTAWVQLQGPTKSEVLKNKQIDASLNSILNLGVTDPFVSARREGYITPAISASGSLKGALKGIPVLNPSAYIYTYDSIGTEGYISRFSTSIVEKLGYGSDTNTVISRREWGTRFKIRVRASVTSNVNLYMGFTNQTSGGVVSTNTTSPFTTSEQGVMFGFNPSDTKFLVFNNDGAGSATNVQSFGSVNKDNTWHTFEMVMSDTNVVCTLDGTNTQTLTTQIPSLTTDLKLEIQFHSLDTSAKVFDISKGLFSSDFV